MIKLQEATRDNLERLWKMQILAFEDLLARYRDFDMSPGAESFETVLAKFEQPWTKYFFILCDDQTIGGVRVVDKADGAKKRISPIWIMPDHRGKGYAQQAIRLLEDLYGPDNWALDTIWQEKGNLHLYEKLGYVQTGRIDHIKEGMDIVYYEKCQRRNMIVLRDMMESDIEDYVRWFTSETEWGDWDAPWEPLEPVSEEEARREWTEYCQRVQNRPADALRWKFEIEAAGRHVGWVSAYTDLGYVENEEGIPAIGLDIPDPGDRRKGYGTQAIQQFMAYFRNHGFSSFYTQTWSDNTGMMKTAEKLGFQEVAREKDCREVKGKKYDAVTFRLDLPREDK